MSSTGILSKGTTLSYKASSAATDFTIIGNVQEIPELGGKIDKVDVTCLDDSCKRNIAGLKDLGDLQFKFLYDNSSATSPYRVLKGLAGTITTFKVTYPDTTSHQFDASVSVSMDGAKAGEALKFTATFILNSDITITDPKTA